MVTNIKTDYDATQKTGLNFNGNPVYTKTDNNKNVQIIKTGDMVIMSCEIFNEMLKMLKYASTQDALVRDFIQKYVHVYPFAIVKDSDGLSHISQ